MAAVDKAWPHPSGCAAREDARRCDSPASRPQLALPCPGPVHGRERRDRPAVAPQYQRPIAGPRAEQKGKITNTRESTPRAQDAPKRGLQDSKRRAKFLRVRGETPHPACAKLLSARQPECQRQGIGGFDGASGM
jgi:hypothetical protein